MEKEKLLALGITEEQAAEIVKMHKGILDGNYVPKSRFNEVNDSKNDLEGQVKDRDRQLKDLKKAAGDNKELKNKIEALEEGNKKTREDYEAKIKQIKIDNAVDVSLKDAGAKNLKAVRALLDLDGLKIDGDSIDGLKEQIESLQKDEGTSFMFDTKEPQVMITGGKPANGTGKAPASEKKPEEMTYSELCDYMEQNPGAEI